MPFSAIVAFRFTIEEDEHIFCKVLHSHNAKDCIFESYSTSSCGGSDVSVVYLLPDRKRRILQKDGLGQPRKHDADKMISSDEKNDTSIFSTSKQVGAVATGIVVMSCALLCPCFYRKKKDTGHTVLSKELNSIDSVSSFDANPGPEKVPPSPLRVPPSPSRFSMSPKLSRLGSIHLNLNQVVKATQNFSRSRQIGEGGFGNVYRADLEDGQVVAIKRAKKEHYDSLRTEFSSEVELLAKIDHRNLVKLLGYVDKGNERLIITEFVPNGTLREHLDGHRGKILDFNQRLEIAIDVAHALTYLHTYAEKQIIHRDVKSSNILLTESMRAKVADFGFARLGPVDSDQTHISTKVKGTVGYLDPEYMKTYQLTPKSDVYSFGVLLLETLTGRRPVELKRPADERVTLRWVFRRYNEGTVVGMVDPKMEERVDGEVLMKMFGLAIQCAAPIRADRPDMRTVGEQLWAIRADYVKSAAKRE
ncbi:calmodulin-binding receptor-like cytoplasmic kinase 3 [Euphorbia peplus]|nr:calmodulin-binding receptor-like cytoplasmic kinase 3 [Euphorbia peplus]